MSDHKYKMFSNYMHNELGITKEDIHIWIKEAVEEIATKMCKNEFDKLDPVNIIRRVIFESDGVFNSLRLQKSLNEEVARQIMSKITLKIK